MSDTTFVCPLCGKETKAHEFEILDGVKTCIPCGRTIMKHRWEHSIAKLRKELDGINKPEKPKAAK